MDQKISTIIVTFVIKKKYFYACLLVDKLRTARQKTASQSMQDDFQIRFIYV